MDEKKTLEELEQITDELMRALPPGVASLTPELEQRFANIVGPLFEDDWKRLYATFVFRCMTECATEVMTGA